MFVTEVGTAAFPFIVPPKICIFLSIIYEIATICIPQEGGSNSLAGLGLLLGIERDLSLLLDWE